MTHKAVSLNQKKEDICEVQTKRTSSSKVNHHKFKQGNQTSQEKFLKETRQKHETGQEIFFCIYEEQV